MAEIVAKQNQLDEPGNDALHEYRDSSIAGQRVGELPQADRPLDCVLCGVHGCEMFISNQFMCERIRKYLAYRTRWQN